eukprot:813579-Amphidinium_carterae.1
MRDGFHTQFLSFGPPATIDHICQCAHPCSPSVHDCACVSGGAMNTYEVAPESDPYATVRHCLDNRSASGFHESCSVSCDQQGSGPSTRIETEQSRLVSHCLTTQCITTMLGRTVEIVERKRVYLGTSVVLQYVVGVPLLMNVIFGMI